MDKFKGKGLILDPTSFRPVAITCALSRVVERVLNKQLEKILMEEGHITDECHGFVGSRGTTTGVLDIIGQLQESIDEGNISTMLGTDISAAFDCLNREKLIRQMEIMGVGDQATGLLKSYFSRRTMQVELGHKRATKRPSERGVLQGSGLSPILFLTYFLRASQAIRICQWCKQDIARPKSQREGSCRDCGSPITYADDLNVLTDYTSFNKDEISRKVSMQGTLIERTLQHLALAMNTSKTQLMLCMNNQRRKASRLSVEKRAERKQKLQITIGEQRVEETDTLSTLGVVFDSATKFSQHWKEIRQKVMKKVYALTQVKNFLTFAQRKELGRGIILSR